MAYEVVDNLPPSRLGRGKVDWQTVMETCDENPGKWVKTGPLSAGVGTHINSGRYPKIDNTIYEATTRTSNGETFVFLRRKV